MDNGLTQTQAAEMVTQLAFYAGWPNAFSALPVVKDVFETSSPLSVRYFSTSSGSFPDYHDGEGLKLELLLAQSAFSPLRSAAWLKIAVSIAPAAAMRSSLTLWV